MLGTVQTYSSNACNEVDPFYSNKRSTDQLREAMFVRNTLGFLLENYFKDLVPDSARASVESHGNERNSVWSVVCCLTVKSGQKAVVQESDSICLGKACRQQFMIY